MKIIRRDSYNNLYKILGCYTLHLILLVYFYLGFQLKLIYNDSNKNNTKCFKPCLTLLNDLLFVFKCKENN